MYLRLSTVPVDQRLALAPTEALRDAVLAGGYRIVDRRSEPGYEPEENVVNIFAMGAIVPEAIAASEALRARGTLANVVVVTAPARLYRSLSAARRGHGHEGSAGAAALVSGEARPSPLASHLEQLLEPRERRAPVVTIADAHSHALAFIGSALGGRTIPLGVDKFGESGGRGDLYRKMAIDAAAIVAAAEAALLELDSYA